ncbi:hypothetical protein [Methylobacterium nodulans]|uniref:Uncharacterized protein n=1 Tax=Methylobacterium nodulans (strain LMG 21967 / CNCM I-2342 / ORS 2060) TaxID=460265 RepID=B8IC70_METNO|nr:hypothetical protein [Methylobacterium nodulans]ACL55458.1 conserved hypothetical protein [Methylobacterium nodulans ORS 2060]
MRFEIDAEDPPSPRAGSGAPVRPAGPVRPALGRPALGRPAVSARIRLTAHPVAALACAAACIGAATWIAAGRSRKPAPGRPDGAAAEAARRLNRASTLLATSVLLDSGLEHERGQYFNRAMVTPVLVSSAVLACSLHGAGPAGREASRLRHAVQAAAAVTGLAGLGFHAYNVGKREGGYSWNNLFYAAPIGAPFALTLAGALGVAAEHVRAADPDHPRLLGLPAGPLLAAGTAFGLAGTVGEAGLLHFRGAFHNPAMLLPVTVPPLAGALMAWAAWSPRGRRPVTRAWLRATAALGLGGVALHAYGVSRAMGGWRNWRQNLLDGPPLPAPPAFTGIALAGLAALDLMERHDHG